VAEPYFPEDVDELGNRVNMSNCPVRFVPKSVCEFLEVYDYQKQFPSAAMPSFEDINPKFWQATMYLEKWIGISMEELNHG